MYPRSRNHDANTYNNRKPIQNVHPSTPPVEKSNPKTPGTFAQSDTGQ